MVTQPKKKAQTSNLKEKLNTILPSESQIFKQIQNCFYMLFSKQRSQDFIVNKP